MSRLNKSSSLLQCKRKKSVKIFWWISSQCTIRGQKQHFSLGVKSLWGETCLLVDSKQRLGSRAELTAVVMPVKLCCSQSHMFIVFFKLFSSFLVGNTQTLSKCGGSVFATKIISVGCINKMIQYEDGRDWFRVKSTMFFFNTKNNNNVPQNEFSQNPYWINV